VKNLERGSAMIQLQLNDEEVKVLRSVLGNYTAHLEVEVHRTEKRDFREALQRREKVLHELIERLSVAA
jgi:hypothetical protein